LEAPGQLAVGSYTGDGLDNRDLLGLGLAPSYVLVLSTGARPAFQRFAPDPGDASSPFGAGGVTTDHVQQLQPDGFQLGASADVNAAGVVHHYVAWANLPGRIGTGS